MEKKIQYDALADLMIGNFSVLVNALDTHLGNRQGGEGDAGQELPSQRDRGMQIFLDSLLRQTHRQIRGEINTRTGNKIDNVIDRLNKSESQMADLMKQYEADPENAFADPRFYQIAGWLEVNQARYEAYNSVHHALASVYSEVFGKEWKFEELNTTVGAPATGDQSERNKALRARFLAAAEAKRGNG